MPAGLRIDYNDGTKVMEITAGLRCPAFGGRFKAGYGLNKYVDIAGFVPGSQIISMPYETVRLELNLLHTLNSITTSGSRVTQHATMSTYDSGEKASTYTFPGTVWQIFPVSQNSELGLLIRDSSDFTAITNATQSGQCVWQGKVSVPVGGWTVPSIPGYSRDNYIVFGRCNSGNTVDFDGTTVRFYKAPYGRGSAPTTSDIDIVIFASGVAPVPGDGLTIINSARQCTFSTVKRPFVFLGGMWKPSLSNVSIGNGYIPLGRYGFNVNTDGGVYTFWMYGVKMQNGKASLQGGVYLGFDRYAIFGNNQVTDLNLPILPDMYL